MINLTEYRTQALGVPDLLLYDSLIEDGVLLLQDGALLAGWSFRGPDMASATHDEMSSLSARLNNILKKGSGWMIQCDAMRCTAPQYPEKAFFPDPVTKLIDTERQQMFLKEGNHFESEYFLTLTYLPPSENEEKIKGFVFEGDHSHRAPGYRTLEYFNSHINNFDEVFRSLFHAQRLKCSVGFGADGFPFEHDTLLRYVRRCVSGEDHPFAKPEFPVHLNEIIPECDLTGGIAPKLGKKHLRVLAIDGFPRTSFPGVLGSLDTLPLQYRWHTRAILLDPQEAQGHLDKVRKKWRSKSRGFMAQVLRSNSGAVDQFALAMSADAEAAMSEASSGDVQFALYTSSVILNDEDPDRLQENVALVKKQIQNIGFGCREESVNAVEAWRGSLPGDGYRNPRRVLLHTINLADMLPITAIWAGEKNNPSPLMPPESPALLYAASSGNTPFKFNIHVGDLGHTAVIGPPGSGKSSFLSLIAAQWFRYQEAQIIAFDKGFSLQVLCAAAGGTFYHIGSDSQLSFCPLQDLHTPEDLSWASDYIATLCALNKVQVTPVQRNEITRALRLLSLESEERNITDLCGQVQDKEIREALERYTLDGSMGNLLDAEKDTMTSSRFLVFELTTLLQYSKEAMAAVLLYLFRQIEKRLSGQPTLVYLDEGWIPLSQEIFRDKLRDWFKTLRKNNAAVLLATQQLSDIINSPIKDVILESCPTLVLLPNGQAENEQSRVHYQSLGLNSREISMIATATPKRHYYVISPVGRRLISLGLGPVTRSFVGVSGTEERQRAEECMRANPRLWPADWLRERGLVDWADYYKQLATRFQTAK
jgi:type IV secretion/conjugal transfer VirB4 family ATPase